MVDVWTSIGITEVVCYPIILLSALYPTYQLIKLRSKYCPFFIRFYLFLSMRIAGSILLIIYSSDPTINRQILVATIALSSIALGFLSMMLVFLLRFIEVFHNPEYKKAGRGNLSDLIRPTTFIIRLLKSDYKSHLVYEEIIEKLFFIAIIIAAISAGFSIKTQVSLQKASSIIYLTSLTALIIPFIMTHKNVVDFRTPLKNRLLILCLITMILLGVRIIANTIAAFSPRNAYGLNSYTIYEGKWAIYTFLIFLEEFLAISVLSVSVWMVFKAETDSIRNRDNGYNQQEDFKVDSSI